MKQTMRLSTLLMGLMLATTPALAREDVDSFSANGKTYEVYVGYGDSVYVIYAGNTDTGYVKGGGTGGCHWKKSGSCKSKGEMLSEIQSKVAGKRY
ncbi:MAG: hypothetical protein Q8M09_01440 [Pseudomonadota bacterium]|nr:hypothetical protein [Pseudomonadota bacterium]MDP1902908.1 hypothetical protein [Pseudomonadota bacterium]MDP2353007.1 hypothetical protein [Pseudomonadota bacterium]